MKGPPPAGSGVDEYGGGLWSGNMKIVVRDEDIEDDGRVTYDELGYLMIPFSTILKEGVIKKSSPNVVSKWFPNERAPSSWINVVAKWVPLKRGPRMPRVSGDIQLSLFLSISDEDVRSMAVNTDDAAEALKELQQRVRGVLPSPPRTRDASEWGSPERRRDLKDPKPFMLAAPVSLRSAWAHEPTNEPISDMSKEAFFELDDPTATGTATEAGIGSPAKDKDMTLQAPSFSFAPSTELGLGPLSETQELGRAPSEVSLVEATETASTQGLEVEEMPMEMEAAMSPFAGGDEAMPDPQALSTIPEETASRASSKAASQAGSKAGPEAGVVAKQKQAPSAEAPTTAPPAPAAPEPVIPVVEKPVEEPQPPRPEVNPPSEAKGDTPAASTVAATPVPPPPSSVPSASAPGSLPPSEAASNAPSNGTPTIARPPEAAPTPTPPPAVVRPERRPSSASRAASAQVKRSSPLTVEAVATIDARRTSAYPMGFDPIPEHAPSMLASLVESDPKPLPPTPSNQSYNTYASKLLRMNRASRAALLATAAAGGLKRGMRRASSSMSSGLQPVDPTWQNHLLDTLSRLEQRDTLWQANMELRHMLLGLTPEQVPAFIAAIRKMTNAKPLNCRIALVRLLAQVCVTHSQLACKSIDGIVHFLIDRIHDPESALREPCVTLTSSIAISLVPLLLVSNSSSKDVDFTRLLGPLLHVISEQSTCSQESAGLCVAAIAGPHLPPLTLQIQTNVKFLDDARDAFRQYSDLPNVAAPPRDMCLLPDGTLLLDFKSVAEARTFFVSRSAVGGMPADWKLLSFPEKQAKRLDKSWHSYVQCLGHFCPRLLHSILTSMKLRASLRRPLFKAIRHLGAMASTQPDGQRIGRALSVAVAPIAQRVITCLKDRRRDHWRERAEAANVLTALARCYDCLPALLEVRTPLVAALTANRFDTVHHVRTASAEALAALDELASFGRGQGQGQGGSERGSEDDGSDTVDVPPPVAPEAALMAGWTGGDMALPPDGGEAGGASRRPSRDRKPRKVSKAGDGAGAPTGAGTTEAPRANAAEGGDQSRPGVRPKSPAPTAAGNNTSTVRILKEISKNVSRSTFELQRKVDKVRPAVLSHAAGDMVLTVESVGQLSEDTTLSMSGLLDRLSHLERSLERSLSPERRPSKTVEAPALATAPEPVKVEVQPLVEVKANPPPQPSPQPVQLPKPQPQVQPPAQPQAQPPVAPEPVKEETREPEPPLSRKCGGVSLWREVLWLVHCGELETAYERVLIDGEDRDVLRLMHKTSICLNLLAAHTKGLLFSCISRLLCAGQFVEHLLPWVFRACFTGDALALPRPVRKDLVKALHYLLTPPPPGLQDEQASREGRSRRSRGGRRRSSTGSQADMEAGRATPGDDENPANARRPATAPVGAGDLGMHMGS
jgi:hypothetical protein